MTTTTEAPAKTACFQLVYSNGEPVDTGDGIPHFPTHDKAAEAASNYKCSLGTPEPEQLHAVCLTISCARCEYLLDEDEEIFHVLPQEVDATLDCWDWKVVDGERLCPTCAANAPATADGGAA